MMVSRRIGAAERGILFDFRPPLIMRITFLEAEHSVDYVGYCRPSPQNIGTPVRNCGEMYYRLPPTRLERVTYCLGGSCSILLSYGGV